MSALLIGLVNIKNENLWNEYVEGVQKSLAPFGNKVTYRGKQNAVLAGKRAAEHIVVIEFETRAAVQNWYSSEYYQSLIPLRDEAADVSIATYEIRTQDQQN